VVPLKGAGDQVVPPRQNGDRLGYVIAVGASQEHAEVLADTYIAAAHIEVAAAWNTPEDAAGRRISLRFRAVRVVPTPVNTAKERGDAQYGGGD